MPVPGRRRFLLEAAGLLPGVVWLPSACAEKEFSCNQTTSLTPEQLQIRTNLAYVDRAASPRANCANCQQFVPAKSGECGGCKVMPGPTHPHGFCKVWVQLL